MAFTNHIYDEGAYMASIKQSKGPGSYKLGEPMVSCDECYPSPPTVRLQAHGGGMVRGVAPIDVDSELMNLNRPLTDDPAGKYMPKHLPNCNPSIVGNCEDGQEDSELPENQDCYLPWEDTRLSNPPCTLRGTGWNRWEWLCRDPQERVLVPFDYKISSRTVAKDNHRPCIPRPLDQTAVLPPKVKTPIQQPKLKGSPARGAYIGTYKTNWRPY